MVYCQKCGNEIPEGSLYCQKCGAKQKQSVAARKWILIIILIIAAVGAAVLVAFLVNKGILYNTKPSISAFTPRQLLPTIPTVGGLERGKTSTDSIDPSDASAKEIEETMRAYEFAVVTYGDYPSPRTRSVSTEESRESRAEGNGKKMRYCEVYVAKSSLDKERLEQEIIEKLKREALSAFAINKVSTKKILNEKVNFIAGTPPDENEMFISWLIWSEENYLFTVGCVNSPNVADILAEDIISKYR